MYVYIYIYIYISLLFFGSRHGRPSKTVLYACSLRHRLTVWANNDKEFKMTGDAEESYIQKAILSVKSLWYFEPRFERNGQIFPTTPWNKFLTQTLISENCLGQPWNSAAPSPHPPGPHHGGRKTKEKY